MTPPSPLARLVAAVEAYHEQFQRVAKQTDAEFETDGSVIKEQMRRHADMMDACRAAAQAARQDGPCYCASCHPTATPTDADVEAVARAIYEASPAANSWGERIEWTEAVEMRLYHVVPVRKQARAALAALRARKEPQ